MIHADMGALEIIGLAFLLMLAIVGFITLSILIYRAMNDTSDVIEDDEREYLAWADVQKQREANRR